MAVVLASAEPMFRSFKCLLRRWWYRRLSGIADAVILRMSKAGPHPAPTKCKPMQWNGYPGRAARERHGKPCSMFKLHAHWITKSLAYCNGGSHLYHPGDSIFTFAAQNVPPSLTQVRLVSCAPSQRPRPIDETRIYIVQHLHCSMCTLTSSGDTPKMRRISCIASQTDRALFAEM